MRRRAPLVVILVGVALAGFMVYGFAQVAGRGPELGGPVVVSHSANSEGATTPEAAPEATAEASPEASPATPPAGKPTPSASPSKRKTKAEPVRPPSPRPGGGDDDDGGGDDDGGDDDD